MTFSAGNARYDQKRMTDKDRLDQVRAMWRADLDKLTATSNELLEAVKLAYRKHHLDDPGIGWDELSEKLHNAINNAIGADGYLAWMDEIGHGLEDE